MDKKILKEDITNMKFLMGYKPGKIISEQEFPELGGDNPFKFSSGLDEYNFPEELKDRLSNIYDLLDEEMSDPDNDPSDYLDMFDFASVVISGVLIKLRQEFGDEFEEYEDDVDDYLRNNEDEYIFDFYNSHSDFDDDEDFDNEEMFEGYEYDDVDEVNPDDFNDDNENDLNQLKQKHGIKFRKDFEGDDDEFLDYLYDNKGSYDNFIKDYKGNKEFTFDKSSYEPADDDIHQLKQKHGVKFRDDFDGDDDEFLDYLYDNKDSFDNFK